MPRLKFSKEQPLYMETAALLRKAIQSGTLPGNSRLDTVTGLAQAFHTSRKVVENAINLLKAEGLLVSRPRQGIYVVPSEKDAVLVVSSTNTRTPETTPGALISMLSETDGRKLEFIEVEFLRHASVELLKKNCSSFSSILLLNQGYRGGEPDLERLRSLGLPVLLPFGNPTDAATTGFHTLYTDMEYGSEMILRHLKDSGCRRVGFIGWHDAQKKKIFRLPEEKYIELIRKVGLEPAENMFGTIHRDNFPGDSSLDGFMTNWQRFDAIFCYSHLTALHLYAWCRKHNVRLPEDLKAAGCGVKSHSELLDPPLTAFHVDSKRHHAEVLNFLQGKFPRNGNINMAIPPLLSIHASTSNKK